MHNIVLTWLPRAVTKPFIVLNCLFFSIFFCITLLYVSYNFGVIKFYISACQAALNLITSVVVVWLFFTDNNTTIGLFKAAPVWCLSYSVQQHPRLNKVDLGCGKIKGGKEYPSWRFVSLYKYRIFDFSSLFLKVSAEVSSCHKLTKLGLLSIYN